MQTTTADQLPDPFNRIELGAVRRQEMKTEMVCDFFAPFLVQACVMVTGIVGNHDDGPAGPTADALNLPEEIPAGLRVKHTLRSRHDEFAILKSHRAEITDALASWGVEADGIGHFRRNPHPTAGSMLLKMHFIHRPQIDISLARQDVEFFYARLAIQDWLWRPVAAVFATENPDGEIVADTDEPSASLHAFGQDTPTGLVHPTSGSVVRNWPGWNVTPPRLERSADRSAERVAPTVGLRTSQPIRRFQNAAPSLRPSGRNHPAVRRLVGKSSPGPRARLHEADGRSAMCHYVGSHLGEP